MKRIIFGSMFLIIIVAISAITLNSQELENYKQTENPVHKTEQQERQLRQMVLEVSEELQNYEVLKKDFEYGSSIGFIIPTTLDLSNPEDVKLANDIREMVESYIEEYQDILNKLDYSVEVDIQDIHGNSIF